ncbi:hypothetical protein JCM10213_001073 [Rhodosporidiobolus nylandii]
MVGTRSQRIPLSSLTALTLHSSRRTTGRRTSPVPQLTCEGKACRQFQPDVVQCVKVGEDGAGGLEWKCEANLPQGMRFGEVEVGCEGWDGPNDPYILHGSCGLTYSLVRSSSHLEDSSPFCLPASFSSLSPSSFLSSGWNAAFALLTLYLAFQLLVKLYRFFFPRIPRRGGRVLGGNNHNRPPPPPGGGGDDFHPPPPPGGPPPPYTPRAAPKPAPEPTGQAGGWRPGFWTGALAGWAANALMGSTAPRRREEQAYGGGGYGQYAPLYGGGQQGGGFWGGAGRAQPGFFGGGGGFGGFGGAGAGHRRGWGLRDHEDDSARGGGGGGMRRSTGFGGTRVR